MEASPDGDRLLVFVVDDDESVRLATKRILAMNGFDVIEAGSAADANRVAEEHGGRIDAVLMDINLPDGWGATVAQQLKETHPELVIVYMTGFAGADPVLAAGLHDAPYFLLKPFKGTDLVEMLRRAIRGD